MKFYSYSGIDGIWSIEHTPNLEAINLLANLVFERFCTLDKSSSRATQNLLFLNNVRAVVISFNCAQEFYNQMQFEM